MTAIAAVVTLALGVIVGYLGQRSRFCFIGGVRDYFLVKDKHLIKGLFGFFIGALISFAIFSAIGGSVPNFPWFLSKGIVPIAGDPLTTTAPLPHLVVAIAGGLGIGFFAVFAGGCPFRQHIMAAEGSKSAMAYLAGFYLGAVIFTLYVAPMIRSIFP